MGEAIIPALPGFQLLLWWNGSSPDAHYTSTSIIAWNISHGYFEKGDNNETARVIPITASPSINGEWNLRKGKFTTVILQPDGTVLNPLDDSCYGYDNVEAWVASMRSRKL
jgi:hypothetical protein